MRDICLNDRREEILSHVKEMPLGALAGAALIHLVHEVTEQAEQHSQAKTRQVIPYMFSSGELLNHSISVAFGAAQLAEGLQMKTPQYLFTAALVHDIGKAVLDAVLGADAGFIHKQAVLDQISLDQAERRLLGTDHAEVGASFLANWQFSPIVIEAIHWHHQPDRCPGDKTVADLIHVADVLCQSTAITSEGPAPVPSVHSLERLGLDQRDGEIVICRALGRMDELQSLLSNTGGQRNAGSV